MMTNGYLGIREISIDARDATNVRRNLYYVNNCDVRQEKREDKDFASS